MPDPTTAIADWTRLTTKAKLAMETLGLRAPLDLLRHYPRRHEDRNHASAFPDGPADTPLSLDAMVADTRLLRFGRARSVFEAVLVPAGTDAAGPRVTARWFNLPWMAKALAAGDRLFAYGKIKASKNRLLMEHPEIEVLDDPADESSGIHAGRITPVYPLTSGITQKAVRALVHRALREITSTGHPDTIPPSLLPAAEKLCDSPWLPELEMLRALHFPDTMDTLDRATRQLAITEFFALQLAVAAKRRATLAATSRARCGRGALLARLAAALPFTMTDAQKRAVREIRQDLKLARPMTRLLQGDVGSGKTAVAMAAIALAVESGCQAAVMAPTQILAAQHFQTIHRLFAPLGLEVAIHTGARAGNRQPAVPEPPPAPTSSSARTPSCSTPAKPFSRTSAW